MHGQTSKQARTIELQFNLAPRTRSNQENGAAGMEFEPPINASITSNAPARKVIDAQNEQEFPSLGGGSVPINIRPTVTLNMRPSTSGLARTKENFPALGGASARESYRPPPPSSNSVKSSSHMNASKLLFNKSQTAAKAPSNQSKTNENSGKTKPGQNNKSNDFPALPGGLASTSRSARANIEDDLVEVPLRLNNASAVSAKHRALVQPYEGVNLTAAAVANQKIKTVQRSELKQQAPATNEHVPSIKSKDSFPALGGGATSAAAAPQWLTATNGGSKKPNQISKKLKVAPAPILPTSKKATNDIGSAKKDEDSAKKTKSKTNEKKKEAAKTPTEQSNEKNGKKPSEKEKSTSKKSSDDNLKKTKQNNERNAAERNGNHKDGMPTVQSFEDTSQISTAELNGGSSTSNGLINSYSSVAHFTMPPPGFPAKIVEKHVKAPPGFENIPKTTVKHATNTMHTFMSPSNSLQRNKVS